MSALITETLKTKSISGRMSTWPVPVSILMTHAAADYALKRINGEAPQEGIDVGIFKQCLADNAGVQCFTRTFGTYETDKEWADGEYLNWFFISEDYITY